MAIMQETQEVLVRPLAREDALQKEVATHSSVLVHGRRILVGYSPRDHKESDTAEWVSTLASDLSVVSVCISLLTCDTERLFIYLIATPISLMARCLFRSFSIFKLLCSFPYCWILRALWKSWIVFYRTCLWQIFSSTVWLVFLFLIYLF